MSLLLLFAGFVLLITGAEALVRGASRLAALAGVPPLIIGLTVVAYGTSAPELAVSVKAGLANQPDIALGNVIGSNIFNVLFILGIAALITPLAVASQLIRLDVPVMVGVSFVTWLMSWGGRIGRLEGSILLAGLVAYTTVLIVLSRRAGPTGDIGLAPPPMPQPLKGPKPAAVSLLFVAAGFVLLIFGARFLVSGAVGLARALGVSELLIGLTVVAAGTSLPEAATSIVASIRGQRDIAVGNIIGSNVFNLLGVLGVAGLAAPNGIEVPHAVSHFNMPIMVAVSMACLPVFITGASISRFEGGLLFFYYVAYATVLALRASASPWLGPLDDILGLILIPATAVLLVLPLFASYKDLLRLAEPIMDELGPLVAASLVHARRALVFMTGFTLILAGAVMLVLPGPGIVTIALGLALLATEFIWARRILNRLHNTIKETAKGFMKSNENKDQGSEDAPD